MVAGETQPSLRNDLQSWLYSVGHSYHTYSVKLNVQRNLDQKQAAVKNKTKQKQTNKQTKGSSLPLEIHFTSGALFF